MSESKWSWVLGVLNPRLKLELTKSASVRVTLLWCQVMKKKKSRQAQIEFPASVCNGQKKISGFGLSLSDVRKVLRKRSVFVIMKNIIIKTQLNLQISVSESNIISTAVLFKMAKRSDSTR